MRLIGTGLLACALVALGCDGPTTPDYGVDRIEVTLESPVLRPGLAMNVMGIALDADGNPLHGREVRWRSLTPKILGVSDAGRVVALGPGMARLRASVGSVSETVNIALVNPAPFSVVLSEDTLRLLLPAGTAELDAVARDSQGVSILRPHIDWESSASRIASVSSEGRVIAGSAGRAIIIAHIGALADTTVVLVGAPASPNAPQVVSASPALAIPGQQLTLTGLRFAASTAGNSVRIDGIPVAVVAATPTQLTLSLPQATQFGCVATGPVAVQVTTSGGIGVGTVQLQVAPQRTLAVGQSIVVPGGLESRCVELAPVSGRYVITAHNTARTFGSATPAFTIGGTATLSAAGLEQPVLARRVLEERSPHASLHAAMLSPTLGLSRRERRVAAHQRLLAANATLGALAASTPARRRVSADLVLRPNSARVVDPVVGSRQPIRVPNLASTTNPCDSYYEIGTRTAIVSPHLVILEDTTPTIGSSPSLRGQIDDLYAQIAAEFETVVWPILATFGDVLVKDSQLDNNGRVTVVFTPRMNQLLGGSLLAATTSCDLFQRHTFESSNIGEYVFAQVPTTLAPGNGPGTPARWLWEMRPTLAHEFKHVVSYAERTVRVRKPEEDWLEEATARHAEELFARAVYGTTQRGNHGFATTLLCEANINDVIAPPGCDGKPRAMLPHFEALWDFLDAPASHSPLGPAEQGDFSYYGSAWSLTRWALDHSGLPEAQFFQALTVSVTTGIANLESRVGRAWPDMVGEWSLALSVDDRPGANPEQPRIAFLSWNLPSVFKGLCDELGPCVDPSTTPALYPRAHPLEIIPVAVGDFTLELPMVLPGGFAALELSGGLPTSRQLIALRGYRGGPLPADARFSILRVQ